MSTVVFQHAIPDRSGWVAQYAFKALAFGAIAFQLWLAIRGHSIRHPDEIFQTIEQSHRLVFSYGLVPWEFEDGLRWWGTLFLLSLPMQAARLLQFGPDIYIAAIRASLALLSFVPVLLLYSIVSKRGGRSLAAAACLLPLLWPENLDFLGSTLSDAIAAPLLATACLLTLQANRETRTIRTALLAFLLVLTFCVRFHLVPALAAIAITAAVKLSGRQRLVFIVAAALWLELAALVDLSFGQYPFQHIYLNFYENVVLGIASHYGEEPPEYYLLSIWDHWGWGLCVTVPALAIGWRKTWLPFLCAALIVAAFTLMGHKEYRFYYPATLLFTFAVSLGFVETALWLARQFGGVARGSAAMACAALALLPLGVSAGQYSSVVLNQREDSRIAAEEFLSRRSDVCGVGNDIGLAITGSAGLVFLHRNVNFDVVRLDPPDRDVLAHYNYLIADVSRQSALPNYTQLRCWEKYSGGQRCVFRRVGGCVPSAPVDMPAP